MPQIENTEPRDPRHPADAIVRHRRALALLLLVGLAGGLALADRPIDAARVLAMILVG